MKKNAIIPFAALAAAVLLPATVSAATVTLDSASWNVGAGWGTACIGAACDASHDLLNVAWNVAPTLAGTSLTFSQVGDSQTLALGAARFAEEDGTIAAGEVDNLTLSGILNFLTPGLNQQVSTATVTATPGVLKDIGFPNIDLAVSFAPVYLTLASGEKIEVLLSGLSWNCQGNDHCTYQSPIGNDINATFTMIEAAPLLARTNIPEPSSLLLMGAGFIGLGFNLRQRLASRRKNSQ